MLIFGSELTSSNRLVLIIFLVIFPFVVLLTFYKLVTKHHVKLYAPIDYRSDESFLSSIDPSETGIRLMEDIDEGTITDEIFNPEKTHYDVSPKSPEKNNEESQLETQIKKIALIEDLVLRELETKFNTAFRRQIGFKSFKNNKIRFDAIGVIKNEYVAVEIKYYNLRTKHFPIKKSLNRIIDQANEVVQSLKDIGKSFCLIKCKCNILISKTHTDLYPRRAFNP